MKILVELEVKRADGGKLSDQHQEDILAEVEEEIPNLNLNELLINEGKSNEEYVGLDVSVLSITSGAAKTPA